MNLQNTIKKVKIVGIKAFVVSRHLEYKVIQNGGTSKQLLTRNNLARGVRKITTILLICLLVHKIALKSYDKRTTKIHFAIKNVFKVR